MFNGDSYPVPPNLENTSPGWVNVGTSLVQLGPKARLRQAATLLSHLAARQSVPV